MEPSQGRTDQPPISETRPESVEQPQASPEQAVQAPAAEQRVGFRSLIPFLVPVVLIIAADRVSKWWLRALLWDPPRTIVVVPGWLELTPVANRGIAFGLLQEGGGLLAVLAVAVLGIVAVRNWRQMLRAPALFRFALGLIAGGAIGNLIDRVELGYVSDFFRVPRIPLFQVFNVADAAIVVGTCLLVLALWITDQRPRRQQAPAQSNPQPTE
jgi:signal peptidase II